MKLEKSLNQMIHELMMNNKPMIDAHVEKYLSFLDIQAMVEHMVNVLVSQQLNSLLQNEIRSNQNLINAINLKISNELNNSDLKEMVRKSAKDLADDILRNHFRESLEY